MMIMNQPSEVHNDGVQPSSLSSSKNESHPPLLRGTATAPPTIVMTPWYHDRRFTQHIPTAHHQYSPDVPDSDAVCPHQQQQQQQQQLPPNRYSYQQPESSSLWMLLQPQRQRLEELHAQIQHREATLQSLQQQSDQACWTLMSQNVENQALYREWRKKHHLDQHIP